MECRKDSDNASAPHAWLFILPLALFGQKLAQVNLLITAKESQGRMDRTCSGKMVKDIKALLGHLASLPNEKS